MYSTSNESSGIVQDQKYIVFDYTYVYLRIYEEE